MTVSIELSGSSGFFGRKEAILVGGYITLKDSSSYRNNSRR